MRVKKKMDSAQNSTSNNSIHKRQITRNTNDLLPAGVNVEYGILRRNVSMLRAVLFYLYLFCLQDVSALTYGDAQSAQQGTKDTGRSPDYSISRCTHTKQNTIEIIMQKLDCTLNTNVLLMYVL